MNHRPAILAAILTPLLSGQGLELTALGGSFPGTIACSLSPGQPALAGAVFFSTNRGPIPLSIFDPNDQRLLYVGTEFLPLALHGIFTSSRLDLPQLQVPNDQALLDGLLHFHALTFPGAAGRLVDRVSNTRAMRFAPANAFRDRRTQFAWPRAFFPVLPFGDDGNRWMICGGATGALLAQIAQKTNEIYDPLTDSWSLNANDMTTERSMHTATRLNDGRWLLVGGVDRLNDPQSSAEIWNPVTNTFTAAASMRDKRMGHTATLLPNGRVLIAGGLSDMNSTSSPLDPIFSALGTTEIYDPVSDTWAQGPAMRAPRAGQGALVLPNSRILLAGGISWVRIIIRLPVILRDCDVYDPTTNAITAGPAMATSRSIFPVVELTSGQFLVSGGIATISLTQYGTPTAAAEVFDAAANAWRAAGTMQRARGNHAVMPLANGRWLAIGGADGDVLTPIALDTTEVYDPQTNAWGAGPRMTSSRAAFGAFRAPTGQFHLLGGANGPTATVVNTTEWFFR
jgi:hypothetical protein